MKIKGRKRLQWLRRQLTAKQAHKGQGMAPRAIKGKSRLARLYRMKPSLPFVATISLVLALAMPCIMI